MKRVKYLGALYSMATHLCKCEISRHQMSYFNTKKGRINKKVGTFIKNCIWLRGTFCFLKFLLNGHPSSKINGFKTV